MKTTGGLECRICHTVFTSGIDRTSHMEKCKRRTKCFSCLENVHTVNTRGLISDFISHVTYCCGSGLFKCGDCSYITDITETISHMLKHARECKKTKIQCVQCYVKVGKGDAMRKHMMKKHPKPTCDICKTKFMNTAAMEHHKVKSHQRPTCELCKATFKNASTLEHHKASVHKI